MIRRFILLTLTYVCLGLSTKAQSATTTVTDALDKPITLHYEDVTLEHILRAIRDQYHVRLAYLNNEIPHRQAFSIRANQQPLRSVLDELFADTDLSYQVVDGQVVLRRAAVTVDPVSPATRSEALDESDTTSSAAPQTSPTYRSVPLVQPDTIATRSRSGPTSAPNRLAVAIQSMPLAGLQSLPPAALTKVSSASITTTWGAEEATEPIPTRMRSREARRVGPTVSRAIQRTIYLLMSPFSSDTIDYLHAPFHAGIIYPLSTNGLRAGQTVNRVSLHMLVGYAAGLNGAEFSGVGNIENDFVRGAQFSGFFNLVRQQVNGVQATGFVNVSGGSLRGAQLAGFVNVGAEKISGLQSAGFVNVGAAYLEGAQLSGFVNLLSDSIQGLQATGFVNLATGGVQGAQLSGFVNYAHRVRGVQASGFVNVASGEVHGTQLSGFVNYAHYVRGLQLGVLNVADSVDGVPIGLVSIVRKNGYRRPELWYSEALQANVALKMGVSQFYNMLVFGADFGDTDFRWGVGYGIGSLLPISSAFSMNLDLYAVQVHESDQDFFDNYDLNLLNTLRLSFNFHLAKRVAVFVAPTFNVMVSQYRRPDSRVVGSGVVPSWTVYDRTFDQNGLRIDDAANDSRGNLTNVRMWPGFQVGVRF